jgi:hypothetical protein
MDIILLQFTLVKKAAVFLPQQEGKEKKNETTSKNTKFWKIIHY